MSYRGVYAKVNRWQVKLYYQGHYHVAGTFSTPEEAAHNYDWHMIELYGKEAYINFPQFDYTGFQPKKPNLFEKKVPKAAIIRKKRLGLKKAKEIRKEYDLGKTYKQLSKKYDVTIGAIAKIINFQSYKADFRLTGTAIISQTHTITAEPSEKLRVT